MFYSYIIIQLVYWLHAWKRFCIRITQTHGVTSLFSSYSHLYVRHKRQEHGNKRERLYGRFPPPISNAGNTEAHTGVKQYFGEIFKTLKEQKNEMKRSIRRNKSKCSISKLNERKR